jgi:hypothetical protein
MMARKKPQRELPKEPWNAVFMGDPFMLNRIWCLLESGEDAFPGTSGSAILEEQMQALLSGESLRQAKAGGELVAGVQTVMDRLFQMRDDGQLGGG